jgi:putative ABC transport system permease protein
MPFIGLAFASRWLIAPLASVLGRPPQAVSGTAGALARENSTRNPARTSVTASALTVGLALVAFVATLGADVRATINDSVRQQLRADYVISADNVTLSPASHPPARSSALSSPPTTA